MEHHLTEELLDQIDQYIKGELKGEALLAFERKLEEQPPLKEEMMIQKRMFEAIENQQETSDILVDKTELNKKIKSAEYQALSQKIKKIGATYDDQSTAEKKTLWIRFKRFIPAAAAILVLVVISTIYLNTGNRSMDQHYYDNVNWETELISFAEKGDSKSTFVKAENFFKSKAYDKTIQSLEEIQKDDPLYPFGLMYIGASYASLNQDQQAIQVFNELAKMTEFNESSKGLWYAALIHLKQNNKEEAIKALERITSDSTNYNYSRAQKILKSLQ